MWHNSCHSSLLSHCYFPQRPTLHWTRERGDILWMKPQTLYRYLKSSSPYLLDCPFNITNFQFLPLNFPNCTLAAFNTSQFWHFLFLLSPPHHLISFSGCLSARGVWGQKGLVALVGLLRWLAPPPFSPSACNSMVCPTNLLSCMNLLNSSCFLDLEWSLVCPQWCTEPLFWRHLAALMFCVNKLVWYDARRYSCISITM